MIFSRTRRLVALLLAGVVVTAAPLGFALPGPPAGSWAAVPAPPPTPYDRAMAVLTGQSAALLRGDEAGWLAAVSPKVRGRYRAMFRSLRRLGVTRFEYQPGLGRPVPGDPGAMAVRADIAYCFGTDMCPPDPATDWQQAPHIQQRLILRPAGPTYLIDAVGPGPEPDFRQPVPWETGELVVRQGRRVTLAASRSQAGKLARVLPVAEKAAAVADGFAALNGTPQQRYRVFLAGEKEFATWFGGEDDRWTVGKAVLLNRTGVDVLLRMPELTDPADLRTTLQHELGHVVTLTGAFRADAADDTWLSEGVAEYIGRMPQRAADSPRRYSVRWQTNRRRIVSMVPPRPGPESSGRAGDAFYGLSHLAADCMAERFGRRRLFTFVRLVLTQDNTYDQASRDAYGLPFAGVDRSCVSWIRQRS